MGLNSHLESYSVKQELIKLANDKYKVADTKKLVEKIQDLEKSLEINKTMLSALLTNDGNQTLVENEVYKKLTEENEYLKKRMNQMY